jgi:FRG domain
MQHYGAPTRLLDWTQGALLALYFAVKDNPGHFDSAVWALDPYSLNRRAIELDEVIPPSAQGVSNRDKRRWLPTRFTGRQIPRKPIAVFPTHIARRISTQRSCFTVHGSDLRGLDRLENSRPPLLRRLVIPSFNVRVIKRELIDSGIDQATIFPDLDGLGRSVGAEYTADKNPWPHLQVLTRLQPSKAYQVKLVFSRSRRLRRVADSSAVKTKRLCGLIRNR